ncbi:transposase -like protein, partial [Brachionus plicatilis]
VGGWEGGAAVRVVVAAVVARGGGCVVRVAEAARVYSVQVAQVDVVRRTFKRKFSQKYTVIQHRTFWRKFTQSISMLISTMKKTFSTIRFLLSTKNLKVGCSSIKSKIFPKMWLLFHNSKKRSVFLTMLHNPFPLKANVVDFFPLRKKWKKMIIFLNWIGISVSEREAIPKAVKNMISEMTKFDLVARNQSNHNITRSDQPFLCVKFINSSIYIHECSNKRLLPFIHEYHQDLDYVFWSDLASAHYSILSTIWMNENVNYMTEDINPPNFPQARPIENIFAFNFCPFTYASPLVRLAPESVVALGPILASILGPELNRFLTVCLSNEEMGDDAELRVRLASSSNTCLDL